MNRSPETMTGDDPPVVFENVTFAYGRGAPILRDLSWRAPATHGLVILRGRSGSGKTTILHLVSGLLRPAAGSVMTLGRSLTELSDGDRRRLRRDQIGHVFQDFRLLSEFTAWENVALPLWLADVRGEAARRRALEALASVGLGWAQDRRPSALSGGEQQRVGLARALATEPQLILADEPTANLDHESAALVGDLLRAAAAAGTSVIVASHDDRLIRSGDPVFDVAEQDIRATPGSVEAA